MNKWMRLGLLLVTFLFLAPIDASSSSEWIKLTPTGGLPPARLGHTSVYDPASNRLIIFGGCSGPCTTPGFTLNDLWVLSNANGQGGTPAWIQLTPTGGPPPPRFLHATVHDPINNRMVIWGGDGSQSSAPNLTDVWVLTNANGLDKATGLPATPNWSQLFPTGGPPPSGLSFPGRESATGVYDSTMNRMIVFGGGACDPCTTKNDVWVLTNANGLGGTPQWLQLFPTGGPPAPRGGHSAVYDAAGNRMVVFGAAAGYTNDTWVLANASGFDRGTGMPTTPAWTQLTPAGTLPPPRSHNEAAYDAATNRMVIFGGADATSFFNDVWLLDNANGAGAGVSAWSQILPTGAAPAPRYLFSRYETYDAASKRMLVFGGLGGSAASTAFNDSWVLTEANGSGPRPAITSISPTSGTQAQVITNFTVNGSNFDPSATLSFSGDAGIHINSSTVTTTQVTANISIAIVAATGPRDVTVANPDGQKATLSGAFIVNEAPPPLLPRIKVLPTSLDFGTVHPGSPATSQTLTVSNTGTAPLLLTGITSSNPAFTFSAASMGPVVPQGYTTITVSLSPTPGTIGTITSVLAITGNAPPVSIAMTGISATDNRPLLLLPIDSPLPGPPLDIQPINNHRVGNKIVTDFILRNLTGTWYEVTLDTSSPPSRAPTLVSFTPQQIPGLGVNSGFLIGPNETLQKFPRDGTHLTFSPGQYLKFRASDLSLKAGGAFALDMFTRGVFGVQLQSGDLSTSILSQLADTIGNICLGSANQMLADAAANNPRAVAWDVLQVLACVIQSSPALIGEIAGFLSAKIGPNAAAAWLDIAPKLGPASIILFDAVNFGTLMVPLAYAQLTAHSPGYVLLEVPLPGR